MIDDDEKFDDGPDDDDVGDYEQEVMVDLSHDADLRHVVLSMHMSDGGDPREYMEQMQMLIDEYGDNPDELFTRASILDDFH